MRIPSPAALAAFAGATLASAGAIAAEHPELRYDLRVDVPVSAGVGALFVASQIFQSSLAPASCRWCDRAADGSDDLNAIDRSVRDTLRWSDTSAASLASHVAGFGLAPLSAFGLGALAAGRDDRLREAPVDVLVVFEAAVIAAGANQIAKDAFGRERPFVHALSPADKARTSTASDNNVSFYSGHSSLTFSLAVASGTVASMRGYRSAPAVWATGLAIAASTAYLRIAADRHYFSDVLTGAALGSAFGFAIPFVFHRPAATRAASTAWVAPAAQVLERSRWIGVTGAF